ncbi:MAG: bifunctional phosphopantothenoylcysteine decarboxylase/phosphopantothenate--cysteine ligase CoaBC [Bacteroidia bacterium]|nr:bifunctional phosphopantothenoylcysteine decarboxylase/phosphopantothenate--cysteine ligase CoaBC [Bacteroidia bacterium]
MRLSGKRILLGVTGSISAYKAASLCRLLIGEGAEVQVVMTNAATDFITPLTLSVLSGKPVYSSMISEEQSWNNHVELGLWADLMVVAPLSANTLAAFAQGTCDTLLQAVYLSARCPVMVAPAMDHDMYLHEATHKNLEVLKGRSVEILGPAKGELASGLIGEGRLLEPEDILECVIRHFNPNRALEGRKVLVSAGPTCEPIDPVRFITNHSTGKMGVALASELLKQGARVILVAGPLQVPVPKGLKHIPVSTAREMYEACLAEFQGADAAIMTAAVADYRPSKPSEVKIKKAGNEMVLELSKTDDITAALGQRKKQGQLLAGFALETDNELENARAKLEKKNLDFIVLNSLKDEGAGFGTDTNKVTLLFRNNTQVNLPLISKEKVAVKIVETLVNLMHA